MNSFMKRTKRIREALEGLQSSKVTLTYADGYTLSADVLEALHEICKRADVVDVTAESETAASLLRGLLGPLDVSGISELEEPELYGTPLYEGACY